MIVSIFLGEAMQERLPERLIQRTVMALGFLGALLALPGRTSSRAHIELCDVVGPAG